MDTYNRCRLLGHAWDDYNPPDLPFYVNGRPVMYWRCERCGAIRREGYTRYGDIDSRKYLYPDGYLVPFEDRPTRHDLRLAAMKERKRANGQKARKKTRK